MSNLENEGDPRYELFWQLVKSIILGFEAADYKWSVSDRENMSWDDKIGKILTSDDLFFLKMRNEEAGDY